MLMQCSRGVSSCVEPLQVAMLKATRELSIRMPFDQDAIFSTKKPISESLFEDLQD